ncbi:MAG: nitrile hydratase subunit beta [Candidatus Rokuibacteriota bacterium]
MNGVHDMGGMHGMGRIDAERDEPVFHAEWERRTLAILFASGFLGKWNSDIRRRAFEQMPPAEYLATSYYEHWLWGLEKLLVDNGILTREEIAARLADRPVSLAQPPVGLRPLEASGVVNFLQSRKGARMDDAVSARFKAGDRVLARNTNPVGHTRLPRYARGRRGVIDRDHGVFVFPDAMAAEKRREPQHCYSVRFDARELWGPEAPARDAIYIDLFEPYLQPA